MPRGKETIKPTMKFGLIIEPKEHAEIVVFDQLSERCKYVNVLRSIEIPHVLFPGPAVSFGLATLVDV
jgi:hypothetical protein